MRAHHHASDNATVPYTPPPSGRRYFVQGGPVELAYSGICHFCGVTHISVIRPFPIPYRCAPCKKVAMQAAEEEKARRAAEPPPELTLTWKEAALVSQIEKTIARMDGLGEQIATLRERRDDLFLKAHELGMTTRALGAAVRMSSPGVASSIVRARERANES